MSGKHCSYLIALGIFGFMRASIGTNKSLMATHLTELIVDIMGFVEDDRMLVFEELIGGQKHRVWSLED